MQNYDLSQILGVKKLVVLLWPKTRK